MKVLITGITGFVGSHLAEFLLKKKGIEVFGIERWRSDRSNIQNIKEKINLIECDIRDYSSVKKAISKIKPVKIFTRGTNYLNNASTFCGTAFACASMDIPA